MRWCSSMGIPAAFAAVGAVRAQPAEFLDLGDVLVAQSPPMTAESQDIYSWLDYGDGVNPGEVLTVKWLRFSLSSPLSGDLYVDIDTRVYNISSDVVLAMYDSAGNLIAVDDNEGGWPDGGAAGLSFGGTGERVPFQNEKLRGQDGTLGAGTYWLAMAAGPLGAASVGATGWDVTTTASFQLGYDDLTTYLEPALITGNVTFPAAPPNNDCVNATPIGEDSGNAPAWIGTNIGATEDGSSPCDTTIPGVTTKDIRFLYTPSQTGFAQVVASTAAGRPTYALLSLYSGGCESEVVKCTGSSSIVTSSGSRLAFPVVQGQPVLFSVASWAGDWEDHRLNVDLMPPPCDLQTPAGAIPESEASCGDISNNGCSDGSELFDPIAPGQAVAGTLFNTNTSRDLDWYIFTVPELATVTFTFRAQLACEAAILNVSQDPQYCAGWSPVFRRTADFLNPCVPTSGSAVLEPGTYYLAITHLYLDGFDCGSGYEGYWMSLDTEPCDRAEINAEPSDATTCPGGTAVFTVGASSPEPITYQWEWRVFDDPESWTPLYDGSFIEMGELAEVSGSDTSTLTITGIGSGTFVVLRATATTCGTARSREVVARICPGDFNCDGFIDFFDFDEFVLCFEGGACPPGADADFNDDGFADFFDYDEFVVAFETGC